MRKLCLIIIDGFGVAPPGAGNARTLAKMPTIRRLEESVPNVLMDASGNAVGLPAGQQGASEPGHLTIGAGRIVWQPLEEINQAIKKGDFFQNPVLVSACDRAKKKSQPLHLVGIYSVGGVHGHVDHMHAMIKLAKDRGVERVLLHLIGDGRDVAEQRFCIDYDLLKDVLSRESIAKVASLIGRFYAMDRDRQYAARTKLAYDLYTNGSGDVIDDVCEGARAWYARAPEREKTDYYIRPLKTGDFKPMTPDDTVVFVNFRSDRMIQIVRAIAEEDFLDFQRPVRVKDVVCMGPYSDRLPVAYPPQDVKNTLGEVIANAGLKQLRLAETDKYAHVTFFFNAQKHEPYAGEERILIESPKVPNFAATPQMSAEKLTDELIKQAKGGTFDIIIANYANPDLVGHGGNLEAAVVACETVDKHLARALPAIEEAGYDWIVTADHGNAEEMYYPGTTTICPSHTANKVQTFVHSPLFPTSQSLQGKTGLQDIAPLCLKIMGLSIPAEMIR